MEVIFHTSVHFILGVAVLNWAQLRLWFWQNRQCFIATYAEVLKYTVKFNMPENIDTEIYDPSLFVQCIYSVTTNLAFGPR